MQFSTVGAPAPARQVASAWTPVSMQLDIAMRPDPSSSMSLVVTQRMQLPTSASTTGAQAATVQVKGWDKGAVVFDERHVGKVWGAERRQAMAVRDALLGSSFLKLSKPVAKVEPLPIGMARITVRSADGTARALAFRMVDDVPKGLAGLDAAASAYFDLVFPDQG